MRTECAKCGTALTRPKTGRPPRYCSTGCRRGVEYDLKPFQGRLSDAEEAIRSWSSPAASAPVNASPPFVKSKAQCEWQVKGRDDERKKLERRMRELLDDDEVEP